MASVGYNWAEGWRLENEFAFTQHDTSLGGTGAFTATGGNQITSDMINLVYDIPLGDTWKFTLGGGVGVGGFRGSLRIDRHQLRHLPRRPQRLPVAGDRGPRGIDRAGCGSVR